MDCTDAECIDWREYVKTNYKGKCFNPMDRDYRGKEGNFSVEIVEGDKKDIDQCDIILVNYVKPSIGTSMEILYGWERDKQILVVSSQDQRTLSPWLIYHCHALFKDMGHAVRYLNGALEHSKKMDRKAWNESTSKELLDFVQKESFCRACGQRDEGNCSLTGVVREPKLTPLRYEYSCRRCFHKGHVGRSVETGEYGVWS